MQQYMAMGVTKMATAPLILLNRENLALIQITLIYLTCEGYNLPQRICNYKRLSRKWMISNKTGRSQGQMQYCQTFKKKRFPRSHYDINPILFESLQTSTKMSYLETVVVVSRLYRKAWKSYTTRLLRNHHFKWCLRTNATIEQQLLRCKHLNCRR